MVRRGQNRAVRNRTVPQSLRAAGRDPPLAFFICGGTLLIAVYGQWPVTLAPYLTGNVPGGVGKYACIALINGTTVVMGNPVPRRFIERAGALRNSPVSLRKRFIKTVAIQPNEGDGACQYRRMADTV